MIINELKRIEIKVLRNDELIYSGNSDQAPEEIKEATILELNLHHGILELTIS